MSAESTPEPRLESGCCRSHPHENMDEACEMRTEIAHLRNELVAYRPVNRTREHPMTPESTTPTPAGADTLEQETDADLVELALQLRARTCMFPNNEGLHHRSVAAQNELLRRLASAPPQQQDLSRSPRRRRVPYCT